MSSEEKESTSLKKPSHITILLKDLKNFVAVELTNQYWAFWERSFRWYTSTNVLGIFFRNQPFRKCLKFPSLPWNCSDFSRCSPFLNFKTESEISIGILLLVYFKLVLKLYHQSKDLLSLLLKLFWLFL